MTERPLATHSGPMGIAGLLGLILLGSPTRVLANRAPFLVHPRAQDRPGIEVQLERTEIWEGESVLYVVTVNGVADPPTPTLGELPDCDVESLGERSLNSSSMQIINGRVTRQDRFGKQFQFRLTPTRAGTLVIPAPRVDLGGKVLEGEVLRLRVTPPEDQGIVRLVVTANPATVYPLQPFEVVLRIFVRRLPDPWGDTDPTSATRRLPALEVPWTDVPEGLEAEELSAWLNRMLASSRHGGFTMNDLTTSGGLFSFFDRHEAVFDLGGHRGREADTAGIEGFEGRADDFWVYTLRRTFTPRRAGTYRFGPVTVKGDFPVEVRRQRAVSRAIYAVGRAIEVTVRDVPETGRPAAYTGGVGTFRITARVVPARGRVGDPMTLTLTVTGQGNLEDVGPPDLAGMEEVTAGFKVYEATSETRGRRRVFTYALRPLDAALEAIPAIPFAYFDVERERFVTIETDPLPVTIEEASRLEDDEIVTAGGGGGPRREHELRRREGGILANLTDPREVRDESVRLPLAGLYLAGLGAAWVGATLWIGRRRRLRDDPAILRRRGASRRARHRLKEALGRLHAGDAGAGAVGIRGAIAGLVADAEGVAEAGLTEREIVERLRAGGLDEGVAARVDRLLQEGSGMRYGAPASSAASLEKEAPACLEAIARHLKRRGRIG